MKIRFFSTFFIFLLATALLSGARMPSAKSSDPSRALVEKAQACMKTEDFDCAIDIFQKILVDRPDFAQVLNMLGMAYSRKEGFTQSAIDSYEQAISASPNFGDPYINLGTLYVSVLKDSARALAYFEQGIHVEPRNPRAYFSAAWIYLIEKKDVPKAREYFEKTTQYAATFAEAYYGLGLCLLELHKRELVLGPISKLRELHKEELASKLEQVMATGDAAVLRKPEVAAPDVAKASPGASSAAKPKGKAPFPFGPQKPPPKPPSQPAAPASPLPPDFSESLPKE